ncbi:hypothetical protein SLEP1_g19459 [Rubroshorea leprosula]|uniref:WW domain-containing protein n=1 Tax=Rubroshorea leprosula TaxID=152421 RepID=A0AAV5J5F8_9ROSI|nr:hypothetical protein SLEP1_g19459 [Rubroshorea leprosula]
MATATVSSSGPRYAPPDPTLPKPWRGLVDGKTGYLYFWNPVTNVTQYERPTSSDVPAKSSSVPLSSSVQVQQSSEGHREHSPDKEDDRHGRGSGVASRSIQSARSGAVHSHTAPSGTTGGSGLSPEAYRRKHEITVTGVDVPPPFTSFEATGFPSEILREVNNSAFLSSFESLLNNGGLESCKFIKLSKLTDTCSKLCDSWRSNVELQTHFDSFTIFTFSRRCDICSWEELMSYAVVPSLLGALLIIWGALIWWTNFWRGLSE